MNTAACIPLAVATEPAAALALADALLLLALLVLGLGVLQLARIARALEATVPRSLPAGPPVVPAAPVPPTAEISPELLAAVVAAAQVAAEPGPPASSRRAGPAP